MSRPSFLDASIPELISKLTTDEKISLLGAPNWWNTTAIPRLGIPSVRMSDGPNVCSLMSYILFVFLNLFYVRAFEDPRISFQPLHNAYPFVPLCYTMLSVRHTLTLTDQCATSMASTFDVELLHEVGAFLAEETKIKSSVVILAPTCNIQRNPLGGRAFESFSEDPHLSGRDPSCS